VFFKKLLNSKLKLSLVFRSFIIDKNFRLAIIIYNMAKIEQKVLKYTVIIEPAQEGGYVAYVPLLPGCVTQGETFEEVRAMATDAIGGYLEVLTQNGEDIPMESEDIIETQVKVPIAGNILYNYEQSRQYKT